MNKIKWAMVFQTKYPYQAEIVIQVLKKNFIKSIFLQTKFLKHYIKFILEK